MYEPAARMMYALPALTDREQAALAAGSALWRGCGRGVGRRRLRRCVRCAVCGCLSGLRIRRIVWRSPYPAGGRWRRARCCRRICAMRTILPRCCTRRLMSCCWITGRPISSCAISIAWRNPRRVTASVGGCQFHGEHIVDGLYHLHFAGEWFSLLSHAHKPAGGRGSDSTFSSSGSSRKTAGCS